MVESKVFLQPMRVSGWRAGAQP